VPGLTISGGDFRQKTSLYIRMTVIAVELPQPFKKGSSIRKAVRNRLCNRPTLAQVIELFAQAVGIRGIEPISGTVDPNTRL
jgi:hypothetical protein